MSKVDLSNSYIKINNEYKIILCASCFILEYQIRVVRSYKEAKECGI